MSGWKRLLDSSSVGGVIPGRIHSHYNYSTGDCRPFDEGTCINASAVNETDCILLGGEWQPGSTDYLGGISNAIGDICGLHKILGGSDVYLDTTNAHPDFTSVGKLNHLVYLTGYPNEESSVWSTSTSASDDTAGAKKLIGMVLDPSKEDARVPNGPNNAPGPYIPVIATGTNSFPDNIRVLLRGYIAVTLPQILVDTDDLTESATLQPGDNLYMSIEDGKLTYNPPTETGQVVRIVGQVLYLQKVNNSDPFPLEAVIYFNPSPVWLEVS